MNKKEKINILYPDHPNGIYMYEYVVINGIKQYIQIRGEDKTNPLILFVHGGPGGSMAGLAHVMQKRWEEHFTVVHWDQRNACKTYLANKDKAAEIAKTGTMEDYIQDIDEVIQYLHTVCDFEKIILLGFSWGTVISSEYAKAHPENVTVYVGVGQLINYIEGFRVVCDQMLQCAQAANNKRDIKKINRILESLPTEERMMQKFIKQAQICSALGAKYIAKHAKAFPLKEFFQSPLLDHASRKMWFKSDARMFEGSFYTMYRYDFRNHMCYEIPVVFITGEEDTSCPHSILQEIIDRVDAPKKALHIVKQAGHACFYDKEEEFLNILKNATI